MAHTLYKWVLPAVRAPGPASSIPSQQPYRMKTGSNAFPLSLRRPLGMFAAAVSLLLPLTASLGQDLSPAEESGPLVRDIRVEYLGARTIDPDRVRATMATQVGQPFLRSNAEEDVRSLFATGDVDNVRILTEPVPGGVRVIVELETRGAVGEIAFVGNTRINTTRLRREADNVQVRGPLVDSELQAARRAIEDLYAKRGFGAARVSYRIDPIEQEGFSRVTFVIDEGDRSLVSRIRFEGNPSVRDRDLRSAITTKKRGWLSFITGSGRTSDSQLDEDARAIERVYQERGFLEANVIDIRREDIGRERTGLVFVINEGPVYTVDGVMLRGVQLFDEGVLTSAFNTVAGQTYNAAFIDADEKTIRDFYGSRGYADATVRTSLAPSAENSVIVVFDVVEGDISFLRRINITGNDVTKDRVIRRELAVAPGEEFNTVNVDVSRRRLESLNYFSEVNLTPSPTAEPGFKDLEVSVREKSTGTLNFGAGFSSIDNLVGFVTLSQTNFDVTNWRGAFRGGGQRFLLNLQLGTKRQDALVSLTEPWFLGRRLSLTGEAYYRDLQFLSDDYEQRTLGGAISLRKPLTETMYAQIGCRLQEVRIGEISEDASDEIRSQEGTYLQSKSEVTIVSDTRDSFFIPRSGHRVELGGFLSGSFLGGDVDVYGLNASAIQYVNLPGDLILSFQGSVATVDPTSGDEVPIFERLFLGGANTLRGFDFRDVGPKDENGEPIGGRTSVFFSTELTFPVIEAVRGALFYDLGLVSEDSYSFSGSFNSNVGIGIRLYLPIGPIRLDYGIPLQTDEFNDNSGRFNFNIGYQF